MKFKLTDDLEKYGFEENRNLRKLTTKYYVYKTADDYYIDVDFIVTNRTTLTFDTSAYGVDEYDLNIFAEILYKLIKDGIIEQCVM